MTGTAGEISKVLFHSYPAQILAHALAHYLWQGALVGLAAGLALRLIRAHAVRLRSAVAFLAVASLAALPPATLLRMTAVPPLLAALDAGHDKAPVHAQVLASRSAAGPQAHAVPTQAASSRLDSALRRIRPWALGVWLAGVALGIVLWGGSWLLLRRLRRHARPAEADWMDSAREAARRMGVVGQVPVLQSERITAPMLTGVLHPCILVPAGTVPDADTRVRVLAHEMAHLLRRDHRKNLLQAWTEILYFFHPAVWYASRKLRIEREHCCDELAAAACGDALSYARALATLEEGRPSLPAFALGSGVSLKHRISRLLETSARPERHSKPVRGAAVAATVLLLAVCSALPSTPMPEQGGGAHPEEVLQRYCRAMNSRDLELFKSCFTDNYVVEMGQSTWGPEDELKSVDEMFHSPLVRSIDLAVELDSAVTRQAGPQTWVIDNAQWRMTLLTLEKGKEKTVNVVETCRLTIVWDPEHGYRISHWLIKPPENPPSK